ncbi:MAG: secondary thiamine-phosphate synthase enzyme YjbQ [Candidatus Bipolaricaulaceae bacterium]
MVAKIPVRTSKREEAVDITAEVQRVIRESGVREGFVIIYVPHDAAAVSIHRTLAEVEAPKLDAMLEAVNPDRIAPEYTKAALVAPTEVGVVVDGQMVLGEDQRIYFYEFDGPKDRVVYVYVGG